MRFLSKLILIVVLGTMSAPTLCAGRDAREATVRIYATYSKFYYEEPWQLQSQRKRSSSGCIISGNRILTSAHAVADQKFIQVRKAGDAKRYIAKLEAVAHECDLAILRVNDDSFFAGIEAVEIGSLVYIGDKVVVYGFPTGGVELCITEGVVSRVEHREYTHSRAYLLSCQIDAAINQGSSGGPVIKDGKLVGVAFQASSGENIGYMVPAPVIDHFLTDMKDGKYDGMPGLGISWQEMENPDLRIMYNLARDQTGILVNKIFPDSPAKDILISGDIMLAINGVKIADNGSIEFREGERTYFEYLVQKEYANDLIRCDILREGKLINVEIRLARPTSSLRLVPNEQYDVAPTYYIFGGLVFAPLTVNYLKTWGQRWYHTAPKDLLNYYYYGSPAENQREVVVLIKVLADEINVGYEGLENQVISYANGRKVSRMKDLVEALEEHKGRYHIIIDEQAHKIVLDKKKVAENSQRILEKFKIDSDRSQDLRS